MYNSAFTTPRRLTVGGRPGPARRGSTGASTAHWASVRSVGYPPPAGRFATCIYPPSYSLPGRFMLPSPQPISQRPLTQTALSTFAMASVILVDVVVRRVDWSAGGTALWLGGFVVLLSAGLGMLGQTRRATPKS
jgi:hypothetical protein